MAESKPFPRRPQAKVTKTHCGRILGFETLLLHASYLGRTLISATPDPAVPSLGERAPQTSTPNFSPAPKLRAGLPKLDKVARNSRPKEGSHAHGPIVRENTRTRLRPPPLQWPGNPCTRWGCDVGGESGIRWQHRQGLNMAVERDSEGVSSDALFSRISFASMSALTPGGKRKCGQKGRRSTRCRTSWKTKSPNEHTRLDPSRRFKPTMSGGQSSNQPPSALPVTPRQP
ncbi:hypothetical protein DFJ77DRAFT_443701 [Powellomyces hirtus]|nr:hypothetical protein DFJ77DRAFT_443701 [Powellomyces hirtus]